MDVGVSFGVEVDIEVDVEVVIDVVVEVDVEVDVEVVVDGDNDYHDNTGLDVAELNTHCRCTTPPPSTTLSSSRSRTYFQLSYRWDGFEIFIEFSDIFYDNSSELSTTSQKWEVASITWRSSRMSLVLWWVDLDVF